MFAPSTSTSSTGSMKQNYHSRCAGSDVVHLKISIHTQRHSIGHPLVILVIMLCVVTCELEENSAAADRVLPASRGSTVKFTM